MLDFLTLYESHDEARRADTKLLTKYIRKQNENGELVSWSIRLASSGLKEAKDISSDFGGLQIGATKRSRDKSLEEAVDKFTIKRLVSPFDEGLDLVEDEPEKALKETHRLWSISKRKNKSEFPPDSPSGQGIRFARPKERGMLLIYPLDATEAGLAISPPIVGIALSFPQSDTAREITYTVNNVFSQVGDYDDL